MLPNLPNLKCPVSGVHFAVLATASFYLAFPFQGYLSYNVAKEDIEITQRLAEAGEIMGIDVLDHITMCDKHYLSLKATNLF